MFPYSIQQIVATEHNKFSIRLVQQVSILVRELVDGLYACNCLFSRRYQLPCQHIFHIDHAYQADQSLNLTEPPLCDRIWNQCLERFGTGKMEMYEAGVSDVIEDIRNNLQLDSEKTSWMLKLGELNEHIWSGLYKLEEENSQLSSEFILAIEKHLKTITHCSIVPNSPILIKPRSHQK